MRWYQKTFIANQKHFKSFQYKIYRKSHVSNVSQVTYGRHEKIFLPIETQKVQVNTMSQITDHYQKQVTVKKILRF